MALADYIPAENRSPGLTASELERAQEEAGVAFPPDLAEFLMDCLPVGIHPRGGFPIFPDWRNNAAAVMAEWTKWLLERILLEVESDGTSWFDERGQWRTDPFWPDSWGERPSDADGRRARLTTLLDAAPRLIPVENDRGIPNDPLEAGNPVFDVTQMEVEVIGSNLEDYLRRTFHGDRRPVAAHREIRFWSPLVGLL